MTFSHLIDELRFREQTARQAPMPGATLPTFVCVACKRLAIGSICAACNQAREHRKTIREAKQCSR